jgi:uncharacterized protein (DUF1778 family)
MKTPSLLNSRVARRGQKREDVILPEVHQLSERIVLSERDTKLVLDLFENPPAPTKALIDAARRYKNR